MEKRSKNKLTGSGKPCNLNNNKLKTKRLGTKINVKAEYLCAGLALLEFDYRNRSYSMAIPINDLKQPNFLEWLISNITGFECKEIGGANV